MIVLDNKKIYRNFKNNIISFWPYLSPTSCISFRKKFIKKFLKDNKNLENKYKDVWLDFRLGIFSYFVKKSFYSFNQNLTVYKSYGESKKYPSFGVNWFFRRMNSFNYLSDISKGKIDFSTSLDYFVTIIIYKILYFFKS